MTPEEIAAAEAAKNKDKPDIAKQIEALMARNAELDAKLASLLKAKETEQEDLSVKAKKNTEENDKTKNHAKDLEAAITFRLKAEEFIKLNGSLLPKDVPEIFKAADKENYESPIEKDRAIKSGLVQSFFSVQSNADLLTPAQKTSLDEYLKLTKTGKQERAQPFYDSVFEPTFEMLKKLKKAEALSKGLSVDDDAETAYKNKLMAGSRKHYYGEKS